MGTGPKKQVILNNQLGQNDDVVGGEGENVSMIRIDL
jgi:hypothetical protein